MTSLQTDGVSVTYGGIRAVDSVSISLESGSAVGLIGPNGAGKSSFLDGITGLTPARGRVILDGLDISDLPAHRRALLGLGRTWQSVELFEDLTVAENLAVSVATTTAASGLGRFVRSRRDELRSLSIEALSMFALENSADELPQALSLGHQKLVGVARALIAKPGVVGLDEPAAGLDRFESREFGAHLRSVVEAGIAVLLIDHDMDLVLNVCDHIYVLDFGQIIAEGTPSQIRSDQRVLTAYLGREVSPETDPGATVSAEETTSGEL